MRTFVNDLSASRVCTWPRKSLRLLTEVSCFINSDVKGHNTKSRIDREVLSKFTTMN